MSEAEPAGVVSYTRRVMSGRQFGSLSDWLSCPAPLCPLVVRHAGRIEDAEPGVSQVCFLSAQPATDVLRHSRSQEAVCAVTHPELLAAPVFLERLEDNEAFSVSGCVPSSRLVPPPAGCPSAAPQVTRVKTGDRRHFCGLDAECYRRLPAAQYDEDAVLRELNKSFLAFQQPGIAKRLSPIGESNCTSRRGSCSPELTHCSTTLPQSLPPPPAEVLQPCAQPPRPENTPQPRPATIGGPQPEPPSGEDGATRQNVLRIISQLQHSIERELGQVGQQANSQIVSQLMERLRTMERGRLVHLLSGAADGSTDDAVSDDASLLTVCEALVRQPAPLTPLDDDYFDWRLEEVALQRGCGQAGSEAAGRQRSVDTDLFLSASSSVDSLLHSSGDSDISCGSAAAAVRSRDSISPERAAPPAPRRRSTFRERLREADSRAERELRRDCPEDQTQPPPAAAEPQCRTTPLICRRTGSLLASGEGTEEADSSCARQPSQRSCSPSLDGNSSRLSFSSDLSSEVAQLCDQFGHWLEEPGATLAPRDLAVLRLTQRLLRRTLSDGCADLTLHATTDDHGRSAPPPCSGARAEAASARARGGPVRSVSLSDPRARQQLVLEVARRLVEPANNTPPPPLKPGHGSVVQILAAVDAATLQHRPASGTLRTPGVHPAVHRFSERLAGRLLPECLREGALHLDFHKAKHRRAYRKMSARPQRRPPLMPPPPETSPPAAAADGEPAAEDLPLPLDESTVEGFSWTLAERLLEETVRQIPSPRRRLINRLISGRAHSLDRKGILKKTRSAASVSRSRSDVAGSPPPAVTRDATVAALVSGSLEQAQSRSLPGGLDETVQPAPRRRKSRRESYQEARQLAGGEPLPCGDGSRPVATGNWGCGRRQGGDPQLKATIQWLGASRAELPCLVYYTCGQPALSTLQWVCSSVSSRQWTVGELASAVLAHCKRRLERAAARPGAPETVSPDLFEELLRHPSQTSP